MNDERRDETAAGINAFFSLSLIDFLWISTMEQLTSDMEELKRLVDELTKAIRWEDDHMAASLAAEARAVIDQTNPLEIHSYKSVLALFSSIIELADQHDGSHSAETHWAACMQHIKDMFPVDHLLLADLYFVLSSLLANGDRLDEALQLCGRGLLLRVRLLGVHEKTAESHFHLGLLYFRKEMFQASLKELVLGKCTPLPPLASL